MSQIQENDSLKETNSKDIPAKEEGMETTQPQTEDAKDKQPSEPPSTGEHDAPPKQPPAPPAYDDNGNELPPSVPPDDPLLPDQTKQALPHPTEDTLASDDGDDGEKSMSLLDHLNELRRCLTKACIAVFLCFIGCWVVVDPIFNTLVDPLLNALPPGSHAMYTTLPEGFFTRMFIAFVAGVFVASPVIFYQIWFFIAPGLYDEEKRYIIPIAFLSALFFIGGGLFCFFIVFPYVFTFFISFATDEIVAMPKVSDYLDFVLKLLIAFGLIFEMPLFSFFLSRMGIVTAHAMRTFRKYAILLIFIVAAILTPPDVVSQLLMAGPMLILYEISILIAAAFGRKRRSQKTDDQANKE